MYMYIRVVAFVRDITVLLLAGRGGPGFNGPPERFSGALPLAPGGAGVGGAMGREDPRMGARNDMREDPRAPPRGDPRASDPRDPRSQRMPPQMGAPRAVSASVLKQ